MNKYSLKSGVSLDCVKIVITDIIDIIAGVYSKFGKELVITSTTDGKHMVGSRHYEGLALDLRIYYFTAAQIRLVVKMLKSLLGCAYDVVLEKDHIHVEFKWSLKNV